MKKLLFLIVMAVLYSFLANAQSFTLPEHPKSSLIAKETEPFTGGSKDKLTIYKYKTTLSQKDIEYFYQERLKYKGWIKEKGSNFFTKGAQAISIDFYPSDQAGELLFMIVLDDSKKDTPPSKGCYPEGSESCTKEALQKSGIKPLSPDNSKLVSATVFPNQTKAFNYINPDSKEQVKEFYLKNMPRYGWRLESQIVGENYIPEEHISDKAMAEAGCVDCGTLSTEERDIIEKTISEEIKLVFKKGIKTCTIYLYSAESANLDQGSTSQKKNDTMIGVYYEN